MKRLVLAMVIGVFLFSTTGVWAQEGERFTTPEGLSFDVPEGWFVHTKEEGDVFLVNDESLATDETDLDTRLESGQAVILMGIIGADADEDFSIDTANDPLFLTGYYAGLVTTITLISMAFSAEEADAVIEVGVAETLEIGEYEAATVTFTLGNDVVITTVVVDEEPLGVAMMTGEGESSMYTETLYEVIASFSLE